mgnify:FL=1
MNHSARAIESILYDSPHRQAFVIDYARRVDDHPHRATRTVTLAPGEEGTWADEVDAAFRSLDTWELHSHPHIKIDVNLYATLRFRRGCWVISLVCGGTPSPTARGPHIHLGQGVNVDVVGGRITIPEFYGLTDEHILSTMLDHRVLGSRDALYLSANTSTTAPPKRARANILRGLSTHREVHDLTTVMPGRVTMCWSCDDTVVRLKVWINACPKNCVVNYNGPWNNDGSIVRDVDVWQALRGMGDFFVPPRNRAETPSPWSSVA